MVEKNKPEDQKVDTTGHSWDGIEEYNNPLPRWWVWTFYMTIIWAIGYTIAYPAWPMISGATKGVMGWSTRANVAAEIEAHEAANADLVSQLIDTPITDLPGNPDLLRYAKARGEAVFGAQCSQCHGSGAAGAVGYPNLLDDDWLWGGAIEEIYFTIKHGIRNESDADARYSAMPAFGEILDRSEILAAVEYVYSLDASHDDVDTDLAGAGATLFADNCASCHGDSATGDRSQGAPNLADSIWLYGGDRATLRETITNARFGVMPAWGQRLSDADTRAAAAFVHSLGGGE